MQAINALVFGFICAIAALLPLELACAQPQQAANAEQLFARIEEQLFSFGSRPTAVTIREVRLSGGGIAPTATRVLRKLFVQNGFKVSAAADAEVEAYLEGSRDEFIQARLELRLVSEDNNGMASVDLSRAYYNSLAAQGSANASAQPEPLAGRQSGPNRKLGAKVEPISEWEVEKLDRAALQFVRDALITNDSDWRSFWSYLNTGKSAPRVNFSSEYVLVLTATADTTINVTLHDGGPGNLDIEPDVGYEKVPTGTEPINAAVFWLPKKLTGAATNKPRVRLGASIERSASGDGLIVKGVDEGSPATQGISPEGQGLGLEVGDTIIAVNGTKMTEPADLIQAVQVARNSIKLRVRDVRTGKINDIEFKLTP